MNQTISRLQIKRNLFSSWLEYGLRICISFLFIPYITSVLGQERYGIWVIVFQTVTYFALFDFGLERALIRFLSRHIGSNNFTAINNVINSAFLFYLGVGTIIILTGSLTAIFLFDYIHVSDASLLQEGRDALIVASVYLGVRFYLLPFAGSLTGFQRHDLVNVLIMGEELTRYSLLTLLLYLGHGLVAMALAIFVVSLLRQITAILIMKKKYPQVTFQPALANRATGRQLFDYTRISFGITVAWIVIFNSDTVLLGLLGTAAAAGVYAPAAQLVLYIRNVMNAVAYPITAAVSQWDAENNFEQVRRLYLRGLKYSAYVAAFLSTAVIIWARPFVALWLAEEFAGAAQVMMILAVGTAIFVPQILGNAILFGIDKHKYLLVVLTCEAMAKLGLALLLVPRYGVIGMAAAASIPQAILYTTLYPMLIARAILIPARRIVWLTLSRSFYAAAITLPAAILLDRFVFAGSWTSFFLGTVGTALVAVGGGYFVLDQADKLRARKLLHLTGQ